MIIKNTLKTFFIFSIMAVSIVACKPDETTEPDANGNTTENFDRTALLTNLANNYIIPAYAEYETQTASLQNLITSFTTAPTEADLQALRTQWETTLLVWQDVAFLEFGPATKLVLSSQTNIYPTDTTDINDNIASGSYNLDIQGNFDAKGFQAIDYLINGKADSDSAIVAYYNSTPNAGIYLQDVIDEIANNASSVSNSWNTSYGSTFIANSGSNAAGSGVSEIINALNLHFEKFVRKGKVGLPAGSFNLFSNDPIPDHVEALYYDQSLPFLLRSIDAISKFINGESYSSSASGKGLDDYLVWVDAKYGSQALDEVIDGQIAVIKTEIANLNDPLSNEVVVNNSAVRDLYQELQRLVPYLKVDMTNALDVLITYQDTDGD